MVDGDDVICIYVVRFEITVQLDPMYMFHLVHGERMRVLIGGRARSCHGNVRAPRPMD